MRRSNGKTENFDEFLKAARQFCSLRLLPNKPPPH